MDDFLTFNKEMGNFHLFKIFYNTGKDEKCTDSLYETIISLYIKVEKDLKRTNMSQLHLRI